MAFVVEDGTGKADANSYGAVADADSYFTDRGNVAWTGTPTEKQAYLIQATDYIEARFGSRFIGTKKTTEQALSWPRENAAQLADNVVPAKLVQACYEYAVRASVAVLAPDPQLNAAGVATVVTKQKVGPLEQSFEPVQQGFGASPILLRPYPAADMLLRGLVYSNNRVIR